MAVCFIVPAILWAVPRFGAIGAAWAWFALNAGQVLIGVHFMYRRLLPDEKWRWYRDAVIKPLTIGTITVLALRQWIVLPSGRVPMAATMIGMGLFVMVVVLWTVPASREFLQRQFKTLRERAFNG